MAPALADIVRCIIHPYIYMLVWTCTYIYIKMYTYVCTYIHTDIRVKVPALADQGRWVIHIHTYISVHFYIYIHIHIYIYTYIHTGIRATAPALADQGRCSSSEDIDSADEDVPLHTGGGRGHSVQEEGAEDALPAGEVRVCVCVCVCD